MLPSRPSLDALLPLPMEGLGGGAVRTVAVFVSGAVRSGVLTVARDRSLSRAVP